MRSIRRPEPNPLTLTGSGADCPRCSAIITKKVSETWDEVVHLVKYCMICVGTVRDPLPWAELMKVPPGRYGEWGNE